MLPVTKTKVICLGDMAANSDAYAHALWKVENKIRLQSVRFGVAAAITAADTDYQTMALKNGSTTIATLATGPAATGTSIAQSAFASVTPDTTAGADEVAAAATLKLTFTKTGNGMAVKGLVIQLDYIDIGH